jgi:hypothetical protein
MGAIAEPAVLDSATTTPSTTTTTPTAKKTSRPVRPSLLGPNGTGRRTSSFVSNGHSSISYRSQSGRTLTFEFKTPAAKPTGDPFSKLAPVTEGVPTTTGAQPIAVGKGTPTTSTNATSATAAVLAKAKSATLPEKAELVVSAKNSTAAGDVEPGVLLGIYDTLTFWCMEAVEVACWGPYDELTTTTEVK